MGETNFIKPQAKPKRVTISNNILKQVFEQYYIEMEDIGKLASGLGVDIPSLSNRMTRFRKTKDGAEIRQRAVEMGHIGENGRRKNVDIHLRILNYIKDHPGSSPAQISAVVKCQSRQVTSIIKKNAHDKVYIHKRNGISRYWIKGTEPDDLDKPRKKKYLSYLEAIRMMNRYYLKLELVEDMAKEVGVTAQAVNNRFSQLRPTKTASDIIKQAKKLGHLTASGRRIKSNSAAFAEAKIQLGYDKPEPPKKEPVKIKLIQPDTEPTATIDITLDSVAELFAKRVAHYLKELER